jgi:hypothetical protein
VTTWNPTTDGDTEYDIEVTDETIWDDGLTDWDFIGNVFLTSWDGYSTVYNPVSDGTTVWA